MVASELNNRKEHLDVILFEDNQLHHIEKSTYNHEGDAGLFLQYQAKVVIPDFEDPFTSLLESSVKVDIVLFTSEKFGFRMKFEFPISKVSFCLGKI